MHDEKTFSTAFDMAKLARAAYLKHEIFRKIVNTKYYTC